jgi:beta-lactamase class A
VRGWGKKLAGILLAGVIACAASAASVGGGGRAPRPQVVHADTAALRKKLDSIADAHHGIVGYSVIDLESGARINRRGDETFPTASLIKVRDGRVVEMRGYMDPDEALRAAGLERRT